MSDALDKLSRREREVLALIAKDNWNFVSGYHYRIIGTHYWVGIIPNPGFSLLDVYVQ